MKKNLSFFLSLIFLVHPIDSEVVIYIADMNEALFIFFGLSALLLLIKWKKLLYSYNRLILLGVLLLLSYFSKETGVLFSAMFFFYGIFYLRHSVKRIILISGITLLAYIAFRYIASSFPSLGGFSYPVLQGSLIERLITMPQIVVYYFSKFILPIHLSFSQAWVIKQIDLLNFFLPLIIDLLIFTCIITCGFFIHKKIYKLFKPYVFFTCWFCLGLAAHLQLIPLDATVADRWFYFPIIGLLGMIGIIVNIFYERIRLDVLASKTIFSIFCVVILLLSFLTIVRNSQWHSRLELYNHDVKYAAQNPVLYGNYGGLLMLNQQFDKAKPYLEKSVSMDPKIGSNINNLAIWYEHNKNYAKAKKLYLENIRLNPNLPRYLAISYGGLARIAFTQDNNPKEAKRLSEMALRLVSVDTQALEFLALSEYKLGNKTNALSISKQLQNQAPNAAGELYNIFSQDKPFVLDNIFGATISY